MKVQEKDLAINGGSPVRKVPLPYGRQWISDKDIAAVTSVLSSDWLTTGPMVEKFESEFRNVTGSRYAVAVSNGTAALHTAMFALGVRPGDEVIVPAITFAATANSVVYQGGTPVFADVIPDNLLIDPDSVLERITKKTRGIIAVDYAGHPCDYKALGEIAEDKGLFLVDDACHALGGTYDNRPVGSLARLNTFSFHPVKHITTGEGGMVTTDDPVLEKRMKVFRNHGITSDHRQRDAKGSWEYDMVDLGYNYRISDIQCALGISQLEKISEWVRARQKIASRYLKEFADLPEISPLRTMEKVSHAYHLFVIRLNPGYLTADRLRVFSALRAEGIGVNVHYKPVYLHPYYQDSFGTGPGLCPVAENAYNCILSLPMFPLMSDQDTEDVILAVQKVVSAYSCRG